MTKKFLALLLASLIVASPIIFADVVGSGIISGGAAFGGGTVSTLTVSDLTASRIVLTDSSKKLVSNGSITTNFLTKSASSGASLAVSSISDDGTVVFTPLDIGIGATPITGADLYILDGSASGASYSTTNTILVLDGSATYFIDFLGASTSTVGFRFDNATNSAGYIVYDGTGTATPGLRLGAGAVDQLSIRATGNFLLNRTNIAGGTTGAQTINKFNGSVNFAAAATTLVVTNSLAAAASNIIAVAQTNDTTCAVKDVEPAAGSFTIRMNAACTAETRVAFWVFN